jgi:hypothetical protein
MNTTSLGALLLTLAVLAAPSAARGAPSETRAAPAPVLLAHEDVHGTQPRELEPRYEPVPPEPEPAYKSTYIFALTRGVTGSKLRPAAQAPLLLLTIPLDIALLPFAAIGGFF